MELRRKGKTLDEIAAELGMTRQLVWYDSQVVLARVYAKQSRNAKKLIRRSLARLEVVYEQAMEGWLRSLQDYVQNVEELKTGGKDEGEKIRKLREAQAGDPRFLQVMIDVEEKRNKLLGLDKTPTVNQTNVQVNVGAIPDAIAKANDDDLLRIVNLEAGVIDVGETSSGGASPAGRVLSPPADGETASGPPSN